jgi:zinc D-Ala-D-Ala carboxypeptidase
MRKQIKYLPALVLTAGAFLLLSTKSSASSSDEDTSTEPGKYFTWPEVTRSSAAEAHGISNEIPFKYRMNARMLARRILDPIREWIGEPLAINSWYRNEEVNQLVSGSDESDHTTALAADVQTKNDAQNIAIIRAALSLNLPFDQLIIYDSLSQPTRIHLSYQPGASKQQILFKGNNGYESISKPDAIMRYL